MSVRRLTEGALFRWRQCAALLRHFWKPGELRALGPAPVMLVCCDADRGYVYDGKRYAQLLDSLNERLADAGVESLTIAAPYAQVAGEAAYGKVVAINGEFARARALRRLKRSLRRSAAASAAPVVQMWGRVIDRVRPRAIIAIQPPLELCLAARDRGVWIADLQHGLLTDEGYYGRAYRSRYGDDSWPDCMLCWDERSAQFIRREAAGAVEARVIGNPWFLRFLRPSPADRLVSGQRRLQAPPGARATILVTLQWGLERYGEYHATGMPAALVEFIRRGGGDYEWWLRIHPMMMREPARGGIFRLLEREFRGHPNVSWQACSETALPVVLQTVDVHITAHSAVTVEAAWFGIRSALLDERRSLLAEWLGGEIQSGAADIIEPRYDPIHRWVEDNARDGRRGACSGTMSPECLEDFVSYIRRCVAAASVPQRPHLADQRS